MKVAELIAKLSELPGDATVRLSVQTEAGFYDVRGKWAGGRLRSVNYDSRRQAVELEGG